ncbi:tRNA (N(6)-L-threonylcarbamoyladenosine(37)-C(2))-methylthiotransferase [Sulfolobus sp. S-194]|uniref:tRNA (N(6)-L-threonylcarbamoyladenosine(37)-C(2))- methylthiotransferase n=1 Tax=Sulfolobus sp. S-194 TaxID=2512240 RepID=UPI0025707935|nr:tRNA (N(6)-L-threonylcarbamoyladenosine(37)-C(2))-methylthiotransferase [Sulfolobus sp. S-194]
MMTLLKDRGHDIVGSYNQADVIVLNTCAVRLETEERMKQRIKELKKIGKKLIIAGCLVSSQPALVMSLAPESSIVGAQSIDKIVEAVESNKREIFLEESKELITPRIFEGKISIIPIADGCAGDCNFCITKLARKKLRSYPPRNIVNAVKEAIQKGAVEIELTAQDTAAYGLDINYNLVELLKEILEIEGNYMIRIGMMTPELAIKQIDKILEIMKDKRVYKFLHLPVQSGDNKVLKLMNRKYTVDEYRELVKEIRNKIPLVNITTDIIIGHPGEDEEAFLNTINLIKEIKFERIHLAMYSIRPNTRSASMPQVPDPIKKERMKIANEVYEEVAYSVHSEYLGSNALVLTTELGRKGSIIGRTINYIPVVVKDYDKLGDWINVKITEASFFDLRGKFIQ